MKQKLKTVKEPAGKIKKQAYRKCGMPVKSRYAYLETSSTATATATVMPTMGLLPAPIRPIISTLHREKALKTLENKELNTLLLSKSSPIIMYLREYVKMNESNSSLIRANETSMHQEDIINNILL